jgi:uncharacterized protein involved in outer membrane biogenesis
MKKLFKWLFRLALVLVLLIVLLILFLDPIAKALVERRIRQQTGLPVKIGKLSLGLKRPTLSIENFKLGNSLDFGGSTFIDVPLLRVQYDLPALRSRRIHLNTVLLNLGELHIVQNKNGKTNLQAVQERAKEKSSSSDSGGATAEFEGIDTLTLTVGRLKFTSAKDKARNEEAYVGYKNESVKNVRSFKDLEPLITRIRLEKKVQFLSDDLLKQGTNAVPNAAPPAGQEAQKPQSSSTDPLKKK